MNVGCFSVDPGGHTGLSWGVFNPLVDPWSALKSRQLEGRTTTEGEARKQVSEIAALWSSFYNTAVRNALLPPERCFLIVEDYVYMPGVNYSGDDAKISISIIWALEGYRMGRRDEWMSRPGRKAAKKVFLPPMILQRASEAKAFATKKRFRDEGCWERGFAGKNEHIFSAEQHIAYFLQRFRTLNLK